MQYLSAYALAYLSGKKQPTEADLNKILQATGKPVDGEQVKKVIDTLKGKNIEDLIKNGLGKVGTIGAGSGAGAAAPAKAEKAAEKPKEDKKQPEKKVEKAPEPEPEPDFGAGDLFGDF